MKKIFFEFLGIILMVGFFNGCNKSLVEEQTSDDLGLKSAQTGMQSYIVLLNDAELNSELSNLKGYEMKQQAVKSASARILKRAGITGGEVEHLYGTAVKGFSVKIPPGQLKKLQDDPSVESIEKDQIVTLIIPEVKPAGKPGGGGTQPSETTPWGISRVGTADGTGKTVWIIDTGVDLDHPDLNVDKSRSRTYVLSKSADDDNGHGSHVAGIIAAKNNTIGVIGVAADATVVAVKVLNRSGSGTISGVVAGVDYVAANGAGDVANMSLGGGYSLALNTAIINAAGSGIKFALAAGNESVYASTKSPASAEGTNIYTISAMAKGDLWAYYSNFGNPPVDYCEPGSSIYSTYKGGGYATMSGTSMAAPHMAGILLLGNIRNGGTVIGDPDDNPDPIGIH